MQQASMMHPSLAKTLPGAPSLLSLFGWSSKMLKGNLFRTILFFVCFPLHCFALHCFPLLCFPWLCFALFRVVYLCSGLLYLVSLPCFAGLCFILLCFPLVNCEPFPFLSTLFPGSVQFRAFHLASYQAPWHCIVILSCDFVLGSHFLDCFGFLSCPKKVAPKSLAPMGQCDHGCQTRVLPKLPNPNDCQTGAMLYGK